MVKNMFFMETYQIVEKSVSESVRLAGKTLIQHLGVFWTNKYIIILILGPKSNLFDKVTFF